MMHAATIESGGQVH